MFYDVVHTASVPNPPTLLIDFDIMMFKAWAALHNTYTDEDGVKVKRLVVSYGAALDRAEASIRRELNVLQSVFKVGDDSMYLYVSSKDMENFRHNIGWGSTGNYKESRKLLPSLEHVGGYMKWMESQFYINQSHTLDVPEADDAIARRMWDAYESNFVSVSCDKDFLCTPGYHYNTYHCELRKVSFKQALLNRLYLALVGDRADNIVSLKGVGPATAKKICKEVGDRFSTRGAKFSETYMLSILYHIYLEYLLRFNQHHGLEFDMKDSIHFARVWVSDLTQCLWPIATKETVDMIKSDPEGVWQPGLMTNEIPVYNEFGHGIVKEILKKVNSKFSYGKKIKAEV